MRLGVAAASAFLFLLGDVGAEPGDRNLPLASLGCATLGGLVVVVVSIASAWTRTVRRGEARVGRRGFVFCLLVFGLGEVVAGEGGRGSVVGSSWSMGASSSSSANESWVCETGCAAVSVRTDVLG